jgi:5-methylcytosine-specific restriction endonuclease McrA
VTYPCEAPEFVWQGQWWSACVRCHRLAWDHEQADPLEDTRNFIRAIGEGLPLGSFPPVMRKQAQP